MDGVELIPLTAWQQAAVVCLFIVLVILLLNWFSKQSKNWQDFIDKSNEKWREFNREQREENNCAMADVNASLSNLTKTTGDLARSVEEMRTDIQAHDAQAKEILALVAKAAPKPRVKKPVENIKVEE
jgi:uncharacterized membrane protein YhiD involved in acid resistance